MVKTSHLLGVARAAAGLLVLQGTPHPFKPCGEPWRWLKKSRGRIRWRMWRSKSVPWTWTARAVLSCSQAAGLRPPARPPSRSGASAPCCPGLVLGQGWPCPAGQTDRLMGLRVPEPRSASSPASASWGDRAGVCKLPPEGWGAAGAARGCGAHRQARFHPGERWRYGLRSSFDGKKDFFFRKWS